MSIMILLKASASPRAEEGTATPVSCHTRLASYQQQLARLHDTTRSANKAQGPAENCRFCPRLNHRPQPTLDSCAPCSAIQAVRPLSVQRHSGCAQTTLRAVSATPYPPVGTHTFQHRACHHGEQCLFRVR